MIKRKSLQHPWKFSWKEVSDELRGLPSVKYHCGVLAVGALKRAIRAYYADKPKPDWLPKEPTREERQALEEEKLMEVLSKRAQKFSANDM